jgi:hypothetical protein
VAAKTIPTTRFIFQNSKNNFKGQTANLSQFANILFNRSEETYQKNSGFSRFSGRLCNTN